MNRKRQGLGLLGVLGLGFIYAAIWVEGAFGDKMLSTGIASLAVAILAWMVVDE